MSIGFVREEVTIMQLYKIYGQAIRTVNVMKVPPSAPARTHNLILLNNYNIEFQYCYILDLSDHSKPNKSGHLSKC